MKKIPTLITVILFGLTVAFGYISYMQSQRVSACQQFTTSSDDLVGLAGEALELSSQGIDASGKMNEADLDRVNAEFDKLTPKIEAAIKKYEADRAACRKNKVESDI